MKSNFLALLGISLVWVFTSQAMASSSVSKSVIEVDLSEMTCQETEVSAHTGSLTYPISTLMIDAGSIEGTDFDHTIFKGHIEDPGEFSCLPSAELAKLGLVSLSIEIEKKEYVSSDPISGEVLSVLKIENVTLLLPDGNTLKASASESKSVTE